MFDVIGFGKYDELKLSSKLIRNVNSEEENRHSAMLKPMNCPGTL